MLWLRASLFWLRTHGNTNASVSMRWLCLGSTNASVSLRWLTNDSVSLRWICLDA